MKTLFIAKPCANLAPLCLGLAALTLPTAARGDVKPAALFAEHAVLQRDMNVPVWGTASPGEKVAVAFCGQTQSAVADAAGNWRVVLQPLRAGGPFEMIVTGNNTVTVKDLLVGEVWLCSGQSNMAWSLSEALNARAEIAVADHPQIRFFRIWGCTSDVPQKVCGGDWLVCNPTRAAENSALAYFFGRDLQQHLDVPVGLVPDAIPSSFAENWTDRQVMLADPDLRPILARSDAVLLDWAKEVQGVGEKAAAWRLAAERARTAGMPLPPIPAFTSFLNPMWQNTVASGMYNGMISPLSPYALRGAVWYQGESNTVRGYQYRKLLAGMIRNWRDIWGQGDFPFLFVQLPNNNPAKDQPVESEWAELRESQLKVAQSLPNTGMAVTIDIGEAANIHPRNKQEVRGAWCCWPARWPTARSSFPADRSMTA